MEPQRPRPLEVRPSVLSVEVQSWRAQTAIANVPAREYGPQGIRSRLTYPQRCGGLHLHEAPIGSRLSRRALHRATHLYDRTLPAMRGGVPGDDRVPARPFLN